MRTLLLGLAATCAAVTIPAAAQAQWRDSDESTVRVHSLTAGARHHGPRRDGPRYDRRSGDRGNGYADTVFVNEGGAWAAYNNQGWQSDSFNDWWHDQPWRSYPRWVVEARQRGTCSPDRMWWSGNGLHC